jgi:hypothetical protein
MHMIARGIRALRRCAVTGLLSLGLVVPAIAQPQSAAGQRDFASPEEAVGAIVEAVRGDDMRAMRVILGPDSATLVASGDAVADRNARKALLDANDKQHALQPKGTDGFFVQIGPDNWPMPIPIVRIATGRWRFDTAQGMQEMIDRRVGRNELSTIRVLLSVVVAQRDYYERMRTEFGVGAFAQRIVSSPGKHNGLIWDTAPDEPLSPLGALAEQEEAEGYPDAHVVVPGRPVPYHGYYFRMLTAQGPSAEAGEKTFIRGGQMTEGFAMVAWPALYHVSGIMTFIVNHDGVVFQKDLGPRTSRIASRMSEFNPDKTWQKADPNSAMTDRAK